MRWFTFSYSLLKSAKLVIPVVSLLATSAIHAQDKGILRGELMSNFAIYDQDSLVGTSTTQYVHEKSSAESWLYLNYQYQGYSVTARFDAFHNSPLLNPQEAYTRQGLAYYSVSKSVGNLDITAGHFYDQFGSGSIFRAFEDRNLGLDYAIQGVRLQWNVTDRLMVKGFSGLQKVRFDHPNQVMKGINAELTSNIGKVAMITGAGWVNRTLDRETMVLLADNINNKPFEERFEAKYNLYAGTLYNTLNWKDFSWYVELAGKTAEASFIEDAVGARELKNRAGSMVFSTLSYSSSGFGVNLQYRKLDNMAMRTSPYTNLLVGITNYLSPLSRQNSFRLPARYSIAALPQSEEGVQAEFTYAPNKNHSFNLSGSYIRQPEFKNREIYQEYYAQYSYRPNLFFKGLIGVQRVVYDLALYQGKPLEPVVQAITPFTQLTYRWKGIPRDSKDTGWRRHLKGLQPSIKGELQYLATRQDRGDFAWILLELNLAPRYSISVSDMVNLNSTVTDEVVHFYNVFVSYTYNQTRLGVSYGKQVEGVVCTGGVCRVEPAFSGVRFTLTTNF